MLGQDEASQRGLERLTAHMAKVEKKRGNFSRRRAYNEDEEVYVAGLGADGCSTFINERNMRFNKKISRAYDAFTKDIKDSFERGTAL